MTRSPLPGLLTTIAVIVVAIIATAVLGVRETKTATADAETEHVTEVAPPPEDPLADAMLNRVVAGTAPTAPTPPDTFGLGSATFEHARSWTGEIEVWRGSPPQLILGPGENWFPAGQPGCGDGRYVVDYAGVDKQAELTGLLIDETGETTHDYPAARGWMLLDDCHLPYVALDSAGETEQSQVTYDVHEYHRAR